MTRRVLIATPITFSALVAAFWPHPREVPRATEDGDGVPVALVVPGHAIQPVAVRKWVRSDDAWRRQLSPAEFAVTRRKGTEPAYSGVLWNEHGRGYYRCVCCGNYLFRSAEKFDSGTGWPSFFAPLAEENIHTAPDRSWGVERTEVTCAKCDAHLGHVFADGPEPTGLRYCINSAALRFEPAGGL